MSDMPIPGLTHVPGYITDTEHTALLKHVDDSIWLDDLKRRVQHYGWRYDYRRRTVSAEQYLGALPDWLTAIADKLYNDGYFSKRPDQMIVNEYLPGQGIARHIDCEPCFGPVIATLTLNAGVLFDLYQPVTKQELSLWLAPCSILILTDAARWHWQHGIAARQSDTVGSRPIPRQRRVSLTFRTVTNPAQ